MVTHIDVPFHCLGERSGTAALSAFIVKPVPLCASARDPRDVPGVPIRGTPHRNSVKGITTGDKCSGYPGGNDMRWLHLTVVIVFAVAILVFVFQNLEFVVVSFLGFHVRTPLAVAVGLVYLLGMATGGSLWALLRRSIDGSKLRDPR
jgi:uncharacterized integral membrane protein